MSWDGSRMTRYPGDPGEHRAGQIGPPGEHRAGGTSAGQIGPPDDGPENIGRADNDAQPTSK